MYVLYLHTPQGYKLFAQGTMESRTILTKSFDTHETQSVTTRQRIGNSNFS